MQVGPNLPSCKLVLLNMKFGDTRMFYFQEDNWLLCNTQPETPLSFNSLSQRAVFASSTAPLKADKSNTIISGTGSLRSDKASLATSAVNLFTTSESWVHRQPSLNTLQLRLQKLTDDPSQQV